MKSFLKTLLTLVLLVQVSLFLTSCSDDDDEGPAGEFAIGVFVVNEGNFLDADGSVTHYNDNTEEVSPSIFSSVNDGAILGDVVQSIAIDNNLAYIVVNNSNKVEVVNANTFDLEYTLEDVSLPRNMTTLNGKGYLTEWVSFSDPGRVSVIDLQNREVETTIETDFGAEDIVAVSGNLYVTNSFTTTVSVINPSNNTVTATIDLGASATQMVVDQSNKIWAISGGTTDFSVDPPVANNNGKLIRIDPSTNAVDLTVELNTNVGGKLAINGAGTQLYFYKGTSFYTIPTTGSSGSLTPLVTEANAIGFYGIGVDPATGIIYAADARGFQGNGTVYRYEPNGTFLDSFTSGRGPNGFVFR